MRTGLLLPIACRSRLMLRPRLLCFSCPCPLAMQGLFQGLWTGVGCGLAGILGE